THECAHDGCSTHHAAARLQGQGQQECMVCSPVSNEREVCGVLGGLLDLRAWCAPKVGYFGVPQWFWSCCGVCSIFLLSIHDQMKGLLILKRKKKSLCRSCSC
ncbi:hypothetical protein DUNSADRAFT_4940, partial [Dunaliella salina]